MTPTPPTSTGPAGGTLNPRTPPGRVPVDSGNISFSRLVYGCWRMADAGQDTTPRTVLARIEACLDHGVTTFDHADIYGDYRVEEVFGAALKLRPELKARMEIVTKCGIKLVSPGRPAHAIKSYDTRESHVVSSVETSLRALGVECVEMLLIHRPSPLLDPHELASAFSRLHKQGKVKAFGVSNFLPHQVEMLRAFSPLPIVANQIEVHPLRTAPFHDGTLDHCLQHGILPMAWSPLAGGRLADPANADPRVREVRSVLEKLVPKYDAQPEALALAWLHTHPAGILPVVGTQNPGRLAALVRGAGLALEQDDWFAILKAAEGRDVP